MKNLHQIFTDNHDDIWVGRDGVGVPVTSLPRQHLENILRKGALVYNSHSAYGRRLNAVRLEYMRRTHQV